MSKSEKKIKKLEKLIIAQARYAEIQTPVGPCQL